MKKIYSLLVMLLLGMSATWATDVTFDIANYAVPNLAAGASASGSTAGDITSTVSWTVSDVTLTVNPAASGTVTRVWGSEGAYSLRIYNAPFSIKAPAGCAITDIAFTAGKWGTLTADSGTLGDKSWSGNAEEVTFTVTANTQLSKIVVTYSESSGVSYKAPTILINGKAPAASYLQSELPLTLSIEDNNNSTNYRFGYAINGDIKLASSGYVSTSHELNLGDRPILDLVLGANTIQVHEYVDWDNQEETEAPVASVTINVVGSVSSVAEFNALDDGAAVAFAAPLTVIAQKNSYLYAQDDSHGILIYGSVGQTYELGNVLPAGFSGAKTTFKGAPEMVAPLAGFEAATSTVLVEPIEISAADLTVENAFRYAVLKNAVVASGAVKDAAGGDVTIYDRFGVSSPEDGTYDIVGVTGWYNNAQFMPLEYTRVGDTPQPTLYTVHLDDGQVNGTVDADPLQAAAGATITLTVTPNNGFELGTLTVNDATGAPVEYAVGTVENIYTFAMPESDVYVSATFVEQETPPATEHELTYDIIGVSGSQYSAWEKVNGGTSRAIYAGKTAGGNNAIQMRSNGSDCGIVTTTSAGLVKSVTIAWNDNTANGRTVQIYGKNTAYSSAADLYGDNQGDLLGEISIDENTLMVTVDGDYAYWGIRSKSGALYLDAIDVVWEEGEVPVTVAAPVISGETPFDESTTVSITCETEGAEIHYYVGDDAAASADSPVYTEPFEITETTMVSAIAIKDGVASELVRKEFVKNEPTPTVENVAEFAALEDNAVVAFANPVTVIAQTTNKQYTYVQDETGGMIIYNRNGIEQEYVGGNVIPAGFQGTKTVYRGQLEMTNPEGLEAATSTVELVPMEAAIADVTAENFGRYAVLRDVTVESTDAGALSIVNGEESVAIFDRFEVGAPEDLTAKYNVYGIISIFNTNLQFLPLVYEKTVEPEAYAIILDAVGQGEIVVNDGLQEAVEGTDVMFKLIADEGWRYKGGMVVTYNAPTSADPIEIQPYYWTTGYEEGYGFAMPAGNVTIHAEFEQYIFNIVPDVTEGGQLEVELTAETGQQVVFYATPDEHYTLHNIVVTYEDEQGEPVEVEHFAGEEPGSYVFVMPAADVNLLVEFAAMPSYGIAYNVEHVAVQGPEIAYVDDEVVFVVTPDEGYILKSIDASYIPANGESNVAVAIELQGPDADGAYSFVMPAGRVAINIVAEEDLPHMTLAQVLAEGVVGETYIIDTDIAVYEQGIDDKRGSMYFITDNDETYTVMVVDPVTASEWPVSGLGAGFKAIVVEQAGVKGLMYAGGGEVIDLAYVVDEATVDRQYEPTELRVTKLNGCFQQVGGQYFLSEFSGKEGTSMQASILLNVANVDIDMSQFIVGERYQFITVPVLKSRATGAPRRSQATLSRYEMVVISPAFDALTGINDLATDDAVSVKYVNAQGMTSDKPFDGLNIVVTKHADGSVTTVKVVK